MMKNISLDIETYSDADLAKCGVYKYAESMNFEILLFGYSVDGDPVQKIDLVRGEKIPTEILSALTNDSVTKWAFNASFERVCLSRYLGYPTGQYLKPDKWKCSMVWSAYMGMPQSLEGVGEVLGLEKQKLGEGKELVRYFCQPCSPTKANGGRTRNLPCDAPDKWEMFKRYNIRDVETEMEIQQRLAKYPVPDFVWDEYHLSEEINDHGVALDMELVRQAIAMDSCSRAELTDKMRKLTDLDNPNSVLQMKRWLSENGMETESLDKKAVAEMMKTAPEGMREILTLRGQLAKSSVKKYQAMENAVCADGRARGMFRFYGANRTGRWCLTGDHEVLTDAGWCRIDKWTGGKIACWSPYGAIVSFQEAKPLSFSYCGTMYEYEDKRISQISTPDHKMYVKKRYGGEWQTDTVENMEHYRPSIPFTGYRTVNAGMECNKLRILVMVQADGCYTADGAIKLAFTKNRKAERCKQLLRSAGVLFSYKILENNPKPRYQFTILSRDVPLWLRLFKDKTFDTWLFNESADTFFDELQYWDGYRSGVNSIQYITCNKKNADIVQAFAHITGRAACIRIKDRRKEHPEWSVAYYVDIWLTPGNCHEIRNKPQKLNFDGNVYCAETKTGYFLVRRNGKVWVTGNSGKLIQMQNLPQNHLKPLAEARALVKAGNYDAVKERYGDVPDTLSQLIRTAFMPKDNHKFIVADFSAIEARIIAWLAGEKWKSDSFANGEDIYCSTASKMFGVPVIKHGVNGELRQRGKVAELACIAEGQPVLTNQGLVPIEKVTTDMKVWDGKEWVHHDGVVYRGKREVITYEGLTATPDHLVWVEGQSKPIQFGIAASDRAHLVQTGDGGRAIRLGEDYQSGEKMERELEALLYPDAVPKVRIDSMADAGQSEDGKIQRLPELYPAKANSCLVGKTSHCGKTKMREPKRCRISQLWRQGHQVRLSECNRGRSLFDSGVWAAESKYGDRSYQQQRKLCTGKSKVCYSKGEQGKPTDNSSQPIRSGVLALCSECGYQNAVLRNDTRRNYRISKRSSMYETKELETYKRKTRLYDIRNAGEYHRFTVSGHLVHNCGYGGSAGALKAMGALDMGLGENELKPLVDAWRQANPNIVKLWWDADRAARDAVTNKTTTKTHGITFSCRSGMLFITLPSGRRLAYVKPRIGENKFGGACVTYEGVGETKKWERLESYGPKFVENIVQGIARDVLCCAMKNLREYGIVMHIHDEVVIEAPVDLSLDVICSKMSQTPPWAKGLLLRADGYECEFYMKD